MFVNAVSTVNSNNAVNRNKVTNKYTQSKSEPAFKRDMYMRVFTENFNRPLKDLGFVEEVYRSMLAAAHYLKKAKLTEFMREDFTYCDLAPALLRLCNPEKNLDYEHAIKKAKSRPYTIAMTEHNEPVLDIVNNGYYEEDSFWHRLMYGARINANIVFHGLEDDANKRIIFGEDFDEDIYVAKGTEEIPVLEMDTFHPNGRIKQSAVYVPEEGYCRIENFNKDGSKFSETQNFIDDFKWIIRNTLNGNIKR